MVIVRSSKSLGGWIKLICRNAYLTAQRGLSVAGVA